jgi:FlaA1/EpsC-like NDP-sugar epimerase
MIVSKILSLPRNQKRLIVLSLDLLIVPFALWCSFSLRLGEFFAPEDLSFVPAAARNETLYLFLIAPVIAIPIFIKFGLYRAIIRYAGFVAMWSITKAVSLYSAVFAIFILLSGMPGVPRSVIIINWLLLVLLIGCTRALGRWW